MPTYRVEVEGTGREIYYVNAANERDAMDNWSTGQHDLTEVYGVEPISAEEVEEF